MADSAGAVPVHEALLANILGNRCALATCLFEQNLHRCSGCKAVSYCSAQHQIVHQAAHKSVCSNIEERRARLERAETDLRTAAPNANLPPDVFNTSVGHFWKYKGTHSFMKAKFEFQATLLLLDTKDAVELALQHCMDLLRLDRSDNMYTRDVVPALLVRLDKEQECYDFIKWWATIEKRYKRQGGYDWGDLSLPHLDIKEADAFESIAELDLNRMGLNHVVALTLLKIRMRLDIAEYTATSETLNDGAHGRQIGEIVLRKIPSEDVVGAGRLEKKVVAQLKTLYEAVHKINPHFWDKLFQDDPDVENTGCYSPGSLDEAQLVRTQILRAWEETEDAQMLVKTDAPRQTSTQRRNPITGALSNPDDPKTVFAMSWGHSRGTSGCHESLAAAISAKTRFHNCMSLEASRISLGNFTNDTPILIANDGIFDDLNMRENILNNLLGGQTVILCGQYIKNVSHTAFRTLMKRLNLPWQKGPEATEVGRLHTAIAMPTGFPNTYKPKAICLKNVPTANIWYVGDSPRDAAVVLKQIGRGRLGYIGDTSGNAVSDQLVLAMCGFESDVD